MSYKTIGRKLIAYSGLGLIDLSSEWEMAPAEGFMSDEKIVALGDYRGRGKGDLRALINMHKEIAKINNLELREYFENMWSEGAKIASSIFHPS